MISEHRKYRKRKNGTGSVYKMKNRKNKPWRAVLNRTTIGYFENRILAETKLNEYVIKSLPENFNITLGEIYNDWKEANPNIAINYLAAWKILKTFENKKMRDMKARELKKAIEICRERHLSRSSCEKVRTLVSHLCKLGLEYEVTDKNYSQFMKMPDNDHKKKDILTQNEIDILWQYDDDRTVKITLILLYTGMRINELLGMQRKNVFLKEGYMIGGEKTAAGIDRTIPIHKKIYKHIEDFYYNSVGSDYLIPNNVGTQMRDDNFRKREFYPMLDRLGIMPLPNKGETPRLTPHSCRHTFISNMVSKGVKPELLQKIAGHKKYQTTIDCYDQITEEDVKEICKVVNVL